MIGVRHAVRSALRDLWAGRRTAISILFAAFTAPLAVVFGAVVRLRGLAYRLRLLPSEQPGIPVVSVGNLAVGGAGKTPVSRWVAEALLGRGWRPAIVLRGYGEDEAELHRTWNRDIPVIVAPRRARGVRQAADRGCTIAVLDDGFQHRALRRNLDVVLLSAAHGPPLRLLPRGPFREPARALSRADHVLVTAKGPAEREPAERLLAWARTVAGPRPVDLFPFFPGGWRTLDGDPSVVPQGPPLVVCSVAEPTGFHSLVADVLGPDRADGLDTVTFADHHPYTVEDARMLQSRAAGRWIATTEKDAVKLLTWRELLPPVRVLPLVPDPEPSLADRLFASLPHPPPRSPT